MIESQTKRTLQVGPGNVVSQLVFFWVFKFIYIVRPLKDFKLVQLVLLATETANINDQMLEKRWKEECEQAAKKNK
jgi:hypothetical protein